MQIISTILNATPFWVYIMLGAILFFGWRASRDATINLAEVLRLPFFLVAWGLVSWWYFEAGNAVLLMIKLLALMAGGALGHFLSRNTALAVEDDNETVRVQGTWLVLAAALPFFVVSYIIGYLKANHPTLLLEPLYGAGLPALAAFLSGSLAGQAYALIQKRNKIVAARKGR